GQRIPPYLLYRFVDQPGFRVELGKSMKAWRQRLLEGSEKRRPLPEWLRPYQCEGVHWMDRVLDAEGRPLLADEMGLGKTVQALTLIHVREALADGPVLIVCPASVVSVWIEEIERFFPQFPVEVVGRDHVFAA